MDKIAHASSKLREELFSQSAFALNTTNAIIEKDFWVVWVLDKIFAHPLLGEILMFKGGTSLSKVFHLIGRFSEDIDLILNWREITQEDCAEPFPTKNKQVKRNEALNQEAHRSPSKSLPLRYSRHYYDLAMMAQSSVKNEALQERTLLAHVVAFKMQFILRLGQNLTKQRKEHSSSFLLHIV